MSYFILTAPALFSIWPWGTNFSECFIKQKHFQKEKKSILILSANCQPFCSDPNVHLLYPIVSLIVMPLWVLHTFVFNVIVKPYHVPYIMMPLRLQNNYTELHRTLISLKSFLEENKFCRIPFCHFTECYNNWKLNNSYYSNNEL